MYKKPAPPVMTSINRKIVINSIAKSNNTQDSMTGDLKRHPRLQQDVAHQRHQVHTSIWSQQKKLSTISCNFTTTRPKESISAHGPVLKMELNKSSSNKSKIISTSSTTLSLLLMPWSRCTNDLNNNQVALCPTWGRSIWMSRLRGCYWRGMPPDVGRHYI